MIATSCAVSLVAVHGGVGVAGLRDVAEEVAVAIVYNGTVHAVLMATPDDLEDLAMGFSVTERHVAGAEGIRAIDVVEQADGIELRIRLALGRARTERRRSVVGGSSCGLCGVESLAAAMRAPSPVRGRLTPRAAEIGEAVAAMREMQVLGAATRSVHAAGWWTREEGLVLVREDVGRHNALDKLAGALLRSGRHGRDGMVVLTSRVSVEMVQKAARLGAPVIAAISAPTSLAVRVAAAAGITLAAVVRDDGFELFTSPERDLPPSLLDLV